MKPQKKQAPLETGSRQILVKMESQEKSFIQLQKSVSERDSENDKMDRKLKLRRRKDKEKQFCYKDSIVLDLPIYDEKSPLLGNLLRFFL